MKKLFTLIELIVVIVVLGILAAIVIPNVSKQKEDAIVSMVKSNTRILQTAVDAYSLKNEGDYPTLLQPTLEQPQNIDVERLYPDYIKSKPDYDKVKDQLYWVDSFGKVWGATVDSPSSMYQSGTNLEWNVGKDVIGYNVYEVEDASVSGAAKNPKVKLNSTLQVPPDANLIQFTSSTDDYLISSIDKYGLESAPAGLSYMEGASENFAPFLNKEGTYYFEMNSEELLYWDAFKTTEYKPYGTSIDYEFAVSNDSQVTGSVSGQPTYEPYVKDFYSLPPSKNIRVKIDMKGSNGKKPSLYFLKVYYHYANDDSSYKKPTLLPNGSGSFNVSPNGTILDSSKPAKSVYEFRLDPMERVEQITLTHSATNGEVKTTYEYSTDRYTYFPVKSILDIPQGAFVHVITEAPQGAIVQFNRPVLKTTTKELTTYNASELKTTMEELFTGAKPKPSEPEEPVMEGAASDPILNQTGWKTVGVQYFFANAAYGQKTHWLSASAVEVKPTNTRIEYRYAYSDTDKFVGYFDDITKVPDSRYLRVGAVLQVKTDVASTTQAPEVTSMRITHSQGVSDLSSVKPTVVIKPVSDNNRNNPVFSTSSHITWYYEAIDPKNKEIVESEWSGDKRDNYSTPGTYEVKLRVRNSSNYWSDWTTYRFEVKEEKPMAVISMTPELTILTTTTITWGYGSSFDPDGDGIVNAEWQGVKTKYPVAGRYTAKLRVQDREGNWSDWTEKSFEVLESQEVSQIDSGMWLTVALMKNKTVKTFGDNAYGQLGDGSTVISSYNSVSVQGLTNVKQIAVGDYHVLALLEDGTVKAWGRNDVGQLGDGTNLNRSIPVTISGLSNVVRVEAGFSTSYAILNDGTVYAWGENSYRQLVDGSTTDRNKPVLSQGLTNVRQISVGASQVMAVMNDGTVKAWGVSNGGSLCVAVGPTTPTLINGLTNVRKVSISNSFSMILFQDGSVKTCGQNSSGQLGGGTSVTSSSTLVNTGIGNAIDIDAGVLHGLALLSDGTVKGWGRNYAGEVGDGTTTLRNAPESVLQLSSVKSISAGSYHSISLLENGDVRTWGPNGKGNLGYIPAGNQLTPKEVLLK